MNSILPTASESFSVPQDFPTHCDSLETSLEQATEGLHTQTEEHIGYLICQLQIAIEENSNKKCEKILQDINDLQQKASNLTKLLTVIETELSNPQSQHINLSLHSSLIEEVNKVIDHPLFKKTQWTRQEAETANKVISRQSEQVIREINQMFTQVTQEVEKSHDYLTTFREILRSLQSLYKCLTDNQKVR